VGAARRRRQLRIVTRFLFRLHPVERSSAAWVMYPGEVAHEVLEASSGSALTPLARPADGSHDQRAACAVRPAAMVGAHPRRRRGRPLAAPPRARRCSRPARLGRRWSTPSPRRGTWTCSRSSTRGPRTAQYYTKSTCERVDDAAVDRLVSYGTAPSSPLNGAAAQARRPTPRRRPEETAFGLRDASTCSWSSGRGRSRARTDPHVEWARGTWESVRWASAPTEPPRDEGADRVREAYCRRPGAGSPGSRRDSTDKRVRAQPEHHRRRLTPSSGWREVGLGVLTTHVGDTARHADMKRTSE
jgi:hypothetical protein